MLLGMRTDSEFPLLKMRVGSDVEDSSAVFMVFSNVITVYTKLKKHNQLDYCGLIPAVLITRLQVSISFFTNAV